MKQKKTSNKITRRESLKIGVGLVSGVVLTSSGARAFVPNQSEDIQKNHNSVEEFQFAQSSVDWIHDALVVCMPAAAIGGSNATIYTPAENGIKPWGQAIIRWLTSRSVRGNGAVLVRQEGIEGGAGLFAVVNPNTEYLFEVMVHLPGKALFGEEGPKNMQLSATVLDKKNHVLAETKAETIPGSWTSVKVLFSSNSAREIRCIVRAKSPQILPSFYYAEGFHLKRIDHDWWDPQNLFCASPTAVQLRDKRELLINTLNPDIVAGHNGIYLNWDGFFTKRGIAVGGGHWEQEYNHLSVDDPMVEHFSHDGMVSELDGKEAHPKSLLWPGYYMCHNSKEWHSYYKKQFTRVAPEVQVLSQDNISSPSFLLGKRSCFCRSCREGFRDWLDLYWTDSEFQKAGISDLSTFDIREYASKVENTRIKKETGAVLADPVLRAYVQFQYISQARQWEDSIKDAKKAAGHQIAILGNQWGVMGLRPYSVLLSRISDIVCTETNAGEGLPTPQKRAWNVLSTKVGQAAGEYKRPVWLYMSALFHTLRAPKSRLRLTNSQSRADGGIPISWSTSPGASGWFYDSEAHLSHFVQQHRALFARCDRYANVGLVYSLPTHAWRHFPAFGLSAWKYSQWFVAFAQLLEESHILYEVNCWWHPHLGDDKISLERFSRYNVLILPGVDCFTDTQRKAVHDFQAKGGKVISVPLPTLNDIDAVQRHDGQPLAEKDRNLTEIDPALLTDFAKTARKHTAEIIDGNVTVAKKLRSILSRAVGDNLIMKTNAPINVWTNVWLDKTRKVLAIHMVNGEIDIENDKFRSVNGSQWKIRLPEGFSVNKAVVISPDDSIEQKSIPVKILKGWATFTVPGIESYTIIALYSNTTLDEAEKAANERRVHWQTSLIDNVKHD